MEDLEVGDPGGGEVVMQIGRQAGRQADRQEGRKERLAY